MGDGEYAGAPFLHAAHRLGLRVVAPLQSNLPQLLGAVQRRFQPPAPTPVYRDGKDRGEIWKADDFHPGETLPGEPVRAIRHRPYKPNGQGVEAEWFTPISPSARRSEMAAAHTGLLNWKTISARKMFCGLHFVLDRESGENLGNWVARCPHLRDKCANGAYGTPSLRFRRCKTLDLLANFLEFGCCSVVGRS